MRVVVTGMGIVSSIGIGIDQFWNAAVNGVSGISNIQSFDASGQHSRIAGQVSEFDPTTFLSAKQVDQTDRFTQLALHAANQAVGEPAALTIMSHDAWRLAWDLAWGDFQHLNLRLRASCRINPCRPSPFPASWPTQLLPG